MGRLSAPGAPNGAGAPGTRGAGAVSKPPRDPGLQPERTRLAWRRTALSCSVAGILAVKAALTAGGGPWVAGCVLAWLGFLALTQVRAQRLTARHPPVMDGRTALVSVVCVLILALCAALVVL